MSDSKTIFGLLLIGVTGLFVISKSKEKLQNIIQEPKTIPNKDPEVKPLIIESTFINTLTPTSPYGYGDKNAANTSLNYLINRLKDIMAARPKEITRTQEINSWDVRYGPQVTQIQKEIDFLSNFINFSV